MAHVSHSGLGGWERTLAGSSAAWALSLADDDVGPSREPMRASRLRISPIRESRKAELASRRGVATSAPASANGGPEGRSVGRSQIVDALGSGLQTRHAALEISAKGGRA